MLAATLPFLIFITNPIGSATELGYAVVVYEKYIVKGEQAPREYPSLEACDVDLRKTQFHFYNLANSPDIMPEYRSILRARTGSMQCLPANAKPGTHWKRIQTQAEQRWRVGSLDAYGFFKGQSLELRQFLDQKSCEGAYRDLLQRYTQALIEHGQSQTQAREQVLEIQRTHRCIPVVPSLKYPNRLVMAP